MWLSVIVLLHTDSWVCWCFCLNRRTRDYGDVWERWAWWILSASSPVMKAWPTWVPLWRLLWPLLLARVPSLWNTWILKQSRLSFLSFPSNLWPLVLQICRIYCMLMSVLCLSLPRPKLENTFLLSFYPFSSIPVIECEFEPFLQTERTADHHRMLVYRYPTYKLVSQPEGFKVDQHIYTNWTDKAFRYNVGPFHIHINIYRHIYTHTRPLIYKFKHKYVHAKSIFKS